MNEDVVFTFVFKLRESGVPFISPCVQFYINVFSPKSQPHDGRMCIPLVAQTTEKSAFEATLSEHTKEIEDLKASVDEKTQIAEDLQKSLDKKTAAEKKLKSRIKGVSLAFACYFTVFVAVSSVWQLDLLFVP